MPIAQRATSGEVLPCENVCMCVRVCEYAHLTAPLQAVQKFHHNPPQWQQLCSSQTYTHKHTSSRKLSFHTYARIQNASFRCQIMTYQLSLAETKWMCVWKHVGVSLREAFATQTERQSALMSRITVYHTPETCKQVQFTKCYCKRREREERTRVCVFVPVLFQTLNYFNTKTRLVR